MKAKKSKKASYTLEMLEQMKRDGKISGFSVDLKPNKAVKTQKVSKDKGEAKTSLKTPKNSKYRNKKVIVDNGEGSLLTFDSQAEYIKYGELLLEQRQGLIQNLQRQVTFPINVNGHKVCKYIADFVYTKGDKQFVIDVKSAYTAKMPVYRLKKKLLWALYGIEIIEVTK